MPRINTAWTRGDVVALKREAPRDHLRGYKETPAGTRPQSDPAAALFAQGGYGCIHMPGELFGIDEQRLAAAIVRSVERLEPAATPLHRAVYRTLARLADNGVRCGVNALVLGLLLGAAKVHKIEIKTHPRDLAKEVGTRYATLLKIRKIAESELRQM